jgi:trk system potassium uptake protein TrkH
MQKILSGVGQMLHVPGIMALLSLPLALVSGEDEGAWAFGLTAVASLVPGQILFRMYRNKQDTFGIMQIMLVATLGWTAVSLLGAIPFYFYAFQLSPSQISEHALSPFLSFYNSFFESLSGYTSTGLTMTIAESKLPQSLQWWRTFTQWIGGIGIIVFISAFHPGLLAVSSHYQKGSEEESMPTVSLNWRKIWWIYIILTLIGILALWLQRLPLWEAINHGMTGISTGGFTINDRSLVSYSVPHKLTVIAIMIIGSLNFNLYHYLFTRGDWRRFITNQQHIMFFALLVLGSLVLYYENVIWFGYDTSWVDTFFQLVSGLGTCGFQTVELNSWSSTSLIFLGLLMLIGGPTASTTGGIKIFRFMLFLKGNIYNSMFWIYHQEPKFRFRFKGKSHSHDEALKLYRTTGTFIFFWVTFYSLMTYVLIHNVPDTFSLGEIAFESASAMGSVGLSVGITGHELNWIAKTDLMLSMLVGRMELIPLIIIVSSLIKNKVDRKHEA